MTSYILDGFDDALRRYRRLITAADYNFRFCHVRRKNAILDSRADGNINQYAGNAATLRADTG